MNQLLQYLKSKNWWMFASGAALMLAGWEVYADRPAQAVVSIVVCLFFLLR